MDNNNNICPGKTGFLYRFILPENSMRWLADQEGWITDIYKQDTSGRTYLDFGIEYSKDDDDPTVASVLELYRYDSSDNQRFTTEDPVLHTSFNHVNNTGKCFETLYNKVFIFVFNLEESAQYKVRKYFKYTDGTVVYGDYEYVQLLQNIKSFTYKIDIDMGDVSIRNNAQVDEAFKLVNMFQNEKDQEIWLQGRNKGQYDPGGWYDGLVLALYGPPKQSVVVHELLHAVTWRVGTNGIQPVFGILTDPEVLEFTEWLTGIEKSAPIVYNEHIYPYVSQFSQPVEMVINIMACCIIKNSQQYKDMFGDEYV